MPASMAYPILAVTPVIGLSACCIAHMILARLMRRQNPYPPLLASAVTGLVVSAALSALLLPEIRHTRTDAAGLLAFNVITYLGLGFCYLSFVNLILTSLRVRVLDELRTAGGCLPVETVIERFGIDYIIDVRLERLLRAGHLIEKDGRYVGRPNRFLAGAVVYRIVIRCIAGLTGTRPHAAWSGAKGLQPQYQPEQTRTTSANLPTERVS